MIFRAAARGINVIEFKGAVTMVYVFLADGFEIIEALSPVDMMRRAGIDVKTVGVTGALVESSCGVKVSADMTPDDVDINKAEAVVVPGGMPGVTNLEKSDFVKESLKTAAKKELLVCAICAGPSLLGKLGLLEGKSAVSYPGFEKYLYGSKVSSDFVVRDGNIITAKGAGVSVDFGLEIVAALRDRETSDKVRDSIQCRP